MIFIFENSWNNFIKWIFNTKYFCVIYFSTYSYLLIWIYSYLVNHFFLILQEDSMLEFDCHYVNEMWFTAKYFEFVEDFFHTANSSREAEDCEPPPCPTSTKTTVTTTTTVSTTSAQHSTNGEAYIIIKS